MCMSSLHWCYPTASEAYVYHVRTLEHSATAYCTINMVGSHGVSRNRQKGKKQHSPAGASIRPLGGVDCYKAACCQLQQLCSHGD